MNIGYDNMVGDVLELEKEAVDEVRDTADSISIVTVKNFKQEAQVESNLMFFVMELIQKSSKIKEEIISEQKIDFAQYSYFQALAESILEKELGVNSVYYKHFLRSYDRKYPSSYTPIMIVDETNDIQRGILLALESEIDYYGRKK